MAHDTYASDDIRSLYKGMVVAVGGPPHSGKSVFLALLYQILLALRSSGVFLQRACPDGEGMWSAESDPEVVAEIRRKGTFSQEFMLFTLKGIESLGKRFPIVLVDLGGRRTAENAEILRRCTHLIILSSKEDEIRPWQEFAAAEGCKTLAILNSQLVKLSDGELDTAARSNIDLTTYPVQGNILNLDREAGDEPYREAIGQLSSWLIAQVAK